MSFLAKIEHACAAFIERTFAKTFPSDLEPTQIARKLVATMEARTHGDEGHLFAPGSYIAYVSLADFERLSEHQAYLEREWAELLRDLAGRVGVRFTGGEPNVVMVPRDLLPVGSVDVAAADDVTLELDAKPPSAHAHRFRLRMLKGVPEYGVYAIEHRASIGRSEDSEVFLVDPSVSRNHAILEVDGVEPIVRDLGSTNGTFVNGERVQARPLRAGDELTFGNTVLRFEANDQR